MDEHSLAIGTNELEIPTDAPISSVEMKGTAQGSATGKKRGRPSKKELRLRKKQEILREKELLQPFKKKRRKVRKGDDGEDEAENEYQINERYRNDTAVMRKVITRGQCVCGSMICRQLMERLASFADTDAGAKNRIGYVNFPKKLEVKQRSDPKTVNSNLFRRERWFACLPAEARQIEAANEKKTSLISLTHFHPALFVEFRTNAESAATSTTGAVAGSSSLLLSGGGSSSNADASFDNSAASRANRFLYPNAPQHKFPHRIPSEVAVMIGSGAEDKIPEELGGKEGGGEYLLCPNYSFEQMDKELKLREFIGEGTVLDVFAPPGMILHRCQHRIEQVKAAAAAEAAAEQMALAGGSAEFGAYGSVVGSSSSSSSSSGADVLLTAIDAVGGRPGATTDANNSLQQGNGETRVGFTEDGELIIRKRRAGKVKESDKILKPAGDYKPTPEEVVLKEELKIARKGAAQYAAMIKELEQREQRLVTKIDMLEKKIVEKSQREKELKFLQQLTFTAGINRLNITSDKWHAEHPDASAYLFGFKTWAATKAHLETVFQASKPLPTPPVIYSKEHPVANDGQQLVNLDTPMNLFEELLATKMKYRLNMDLTLLGLLWGKSRTTVSRIVANTAPIWRAAGTKLENTPKLSLDGVTAAGINLASGNHSNNGGMGGPNGVLGIYGGELGSGGGSGSGAGGGGGMGLGMPSSSSTSAASEMRSAMHGGMPSSASVPVSISAGMNAAMSSSSAHLHHDIPDSPSDDDSIADDGRAGLDGLGGGGTLGGMVPAGGSAEGANGAGVSAGPPSGSSFAGFSAGMPTAAAMLYGAAVKADAVGRRRNSGSNHTGVGAVAKAKATGIGSNNSSSNANSNPNPLHKLV